MANYMQGMCQGYVKNMTKFDDIRPNFGNKQQHYGNKIILLIKQEQ